MNFDDNTPLDREEATMDRETWYIEASTEDEALDKAKSTVDWVNEVGIHGFVRVLGQDCAENETKNWKAYDPDADIQPPEFFESDPIWEVEFVKTLDIAENADPEDIPGKLVGDGDA